MLFVSIALALLIVYLVQARIFNRHAFDRLRYHVTLSAEEVFVDEDVFMYEELSNEKNLPIPNLKVDTELPEGLQFRLRSREKALQNTSADQYRQSVQSIFVLGSNKQVRRRWRVTCQKRGIYHIGSVLMVINDLLGFNAQSRRIEVPQGKHNQIVVLPKAIDLDEHFTSSYTLNGDVIVPHSLLTDPLRLCGTRDYTPYDPMNRINWKSTAAHDRLMVNVEEYSQRHQFNIVMNMQSRDIELHPDTPSAPEFVELCITVCASIIDKVSPENIPIRIFANTPPASVGEQAAGEDEIGGQILMTRAFQGKRDMIAALRLLAALQMKVSCPIEKMLDHIAAHAYSYANGSNIIVISPYISERMIIFHDTLERQGIKVIFYVTTTYQNAWNIPKNIEVYYHTY